MSSRRPSRLVLAALTLAAACLAGCPRDEHAEPGPAPAEVGGTPLASPAAKARAGWPGHLTRVDIGQRLEAPVALVVPPDGGGKRYVVERGGRVVVLPDRGGGGVLRMFLDLRLRMRKLRGDDGLLGLAFHPAFARDRRVFATYVAPGPMRLVLSEYTAAPESPDQMDVTTERMLMQVPLPLDSHRGGGLAFGREGQLYVGVGDGGGYRDPFGHARDLGSMLGKILAVDVDAMASDRGYAIPLTNPFLVATDGELPEVFAAGFCDPRHFAVDPANGRLWASDSTAGLGEEIHLVEPGRSHGWGSAPAAGAPVDRRPPIAPIVSYGGREGMGIVGPIIYRGRRWPALAGHLVYADRVTGRIWRRTLAKGGRPVELTQLAGGVAALSTDGADGLCVLGRDGQVYELE